MLIGYARVSTVEQSVGLQLDALHAAGVERIFTDEGISGSVSSRPELDKCLVHLRSGDTLVVWRLDRLARSLKNLLELVESLSQRGIHLRSLTESIDTSSASGRLVLSVFGALAEFERSLIIERTQAGLMAARLRGAKIGRPAAMSAGQVEQAKTLVGAGHRVSEVARSLGVGRSTLYRVLGEAG
ncbi:resolvase [Mycobacteroides abscessus subsp. abscessus]|uniref:Resolvase n=1 Tax=Mycobacteroides abscessus subsp. bolletii TaxID=319705 RepID=A0A9Q7WKN3_9MYCO|nr:recombinase family protein [Mycobacteroides abscessus]SHU56072.1 resolvase [Mycobacteroides abscessus subsp. bolletii]SHU74086.1 resolvase [Mycobacteroides abscessus subsp. bolletii]SHX82996.1 resolvase [Mycobacteroides abscessus subsp. bolletii]SIE10913.1 site-specific recombinase PinR [Mycobacteroides abscessus subsp. abscessus]SIG01671.1 resolvase [Mycobacteroides abscessus subsp. abscessus]